MVVEVEIKLQELAKLALGTPQLTNLNVALLQSLIEILLKKLNCHDEAVLLNPFEAKHLEKLLKTAKVSPIVFNDEGVEKVSEKIERLNKLQENVQNLEEKLNRHLVETQAPSNFNETNIDLDNWTNCDGEHLCSVCDEENELACTILKNTDFLKKLQRRMSQPIVDNLIKIESKTEKLNEEFQNFMRRAKEIYLNIQLLEKCMEEIEKLRAIIEEQKKLFLMTMEEIQDMLDSKLDKIHVPALKKYIRNNFERIDSIINMLQNKKTCPRAAGIIMEGLRCASCGNTNVCSEVGVEASSMLPDMMPKKDKARKYCGASHQLKSIHNTAKSYNLDAAEIIKQKKTFSKCGKAEKDFEWLEGFDGKLYRKG